MKTIASAAHAISSLANYASWMFHRAAEYLSIEENRKEIRFIFLILGLMCLSELLMLSAFGLMEG